MNEWILNIKKKNLSFQLSIIINYSVGKITGNRL
jgi:hypothetical protein